MAICLLARSIWRSARLSSIDAHSLNVVTPRAPAGGTRPKHEMRRQGRT